MNKHVPVLLKETLEEFDSILSAKEEVYVIDCTLGQAGHSLELFKKIKKGVLISIDLDVNSIQWVANEYKFESIIENSHSTEGVFEHREEDKVWYLVQGSFKDIKKIKDSFKISKFDFILADLGFSNYQLTKNLGISYDRPGQRLDMRYDSELSMFSNQSSMTAAEILNTFEKKELIEIFEERGQIENAKFLVDEIAAKRKINPFEKVKDILAILNKPKYPKNFKTKVFQALRSFVNREQESLLEFLEQIPEVLSTKGKALIISFNSLEEKLIATKLPQITIREPNILEIINNSQSRSAKLFVFKRKESTEDPKEKFGI